MHINQLRVGTTTPTTLRLGTVPVERAYLGATLVYGETDDPVPTYSGLVLAHAPLLYWRLGDTAGTTATDSSGQGRDGVYIGTPSLDTPSLLADGDGASVYFDNGGNMRAGLTSAGWMNVPAMTITCVYLSSFVAQTNLQMIAARYYDDASNYSWWLYREDNEFKFAYRSSGGQVTTISSGVIEQHGQIYYVAAYAGAAGAGIRVYSSGQLLGNITGAAYAVGSSSGSFAIGGCDTGSYKLTGVVQEVAYFGSILTGVELDALAIRATAPQPQWLNHTAGVAMRNGTSGHTLVFPSASASSFLVAVVAGSVTSTAVTPGWTKRLGPAYECEYAVFTRTASSGDTSLALIHNGANYPVNYAVYEFPAGTTWVAGADEPNGQAPNVMGLPGTPVTVFAGLGISSNSLGDPIASASWGWRWFEDVDAMTAYDGVTDGIYMTLGWRRGVRVATSSPSTEGFFGPVYEITNPFNNRTSITFALNIP